MNVEEKEKISWRKKDKDNKSINNINNKKKYTNKEKEYINKYLIVSKNIISEEKLYNIIIKFNFNEQLILSEIFHILEEESENEISEENINNIKTNESIFVPYKTQFGIMKSIYSLKNENKSKNKILSKDKKIYKYEKMNLKKNNKNEEKLDKLIYNENILDKNQFYQKRFSNFNKIIEDYKNKKYKENNNNFYKKINKIHKNKYFGGKINTNHNNDNDIVTHKYYNSKQSNTENNESISKSKYNNYIKENIINLSYIHPDIKIKDKKINFEISDKSELIINATYNNSNKEKEEHKYNNINNNNYEIDKNKNLVYNINKEIIEDNNNIFKKNDIQNNFNIDQNQNNNKKIIFTNNNNPINFKYINEDQKDYYNNSNNNNYMNYQAQLNYTNKNIYKYKSINYIENNKNNFVNNSYNYNINLATSNIYNNVNNNFNKQINYNNNILYNNKKIGVPIYFYPLYFKSNNIMMSKNINICPNIYNNCCANSFYNPNMIRMYYQGFNNNQYIETAKNINMNNKNFNYKNLAPFNPMIYYFLLRKFWLKFAPNYEKN